MSALWLPMAQAFVTWLSPQLGPLALATPLTIDKQTKGHPRLPARPVEECPKLVLSGYTHATKPLPGGRANFDLDMSLWFYRRQIPGTENHQEKLIEALDFICGLLDQHYLPNELASAGAQLVMVAQRIVHEELADPLGEPRLRVNPGEIQLKFQASS